MFDFLGRAIGAFADNGDAGESVVDAVAGVFGVDVGRERRADEGEHIVYERYLTRPRDPKVNDR